MLPRYHCDILITFKYATTHWCVIRQGEEGEYSLRTILSDFFSETIFSLVFVWLDVFNRPLDIEVRSAHKPVNRRVGREEIR